MRFRSYRAAFGMALTLFVTAVVAACDTAADSLAPEQRPTSALRLLTVLPTAPLLATTSVSFYAVKGRNAGADLWYRARPGRTDSTKMLEFRLNGASLERRPDGSAFADGDSIRITITVVSPTNLIVDFQPSGLKFSAKEPARLKIFFGECGDDLDRDGQVTSSDDAIAQQLSIWRQETPTAPWIKLSTAVVKEDRLVDALLGGFTGYAVAY
jgi:hypothetical protein